jgi:molybdopterin converting factor small subunit
MQITIKYLAQLKQAAGITHETIDIELPCVPSTVLQRLSERHNDHFRRLLFDQDGKLHPAILLFVGQNQVRPDTPCIFREGDIMTILSPMAGG